MTIWKFDLKDLRVQIIGMPVGAKLLTVAMQHETPRLWALVNDTGDIVNRRILTYGTGHAGATAGDYIGTYQLLEGALVFHVFDGGEENG